MAVMIQDRMENLIVDYPSYPRQRWLFQILLLWILGITFPTLAGQIPFVLPWNDASPGITDLSAWNPPITSESRVAVDQNGHFVVNGQRIKFLGMNFAGESPFQPTNKSDAVAARIAKFGINCVRFHHMDAPWALNGGLIDYRKGDSRHINLQQLTLVHHLVSRLKAHGIYANINLLVGREFKTADGLPAEIASMDWKDQHILGFFNSTALALHQEYARQVLTPTNPFTGLSLAQDPCVAFVEIMNENGMIQKWFEGVLDQLPAVFASQLRDRWNLWLANRYDSHSTLVAAWGAIDQPLGTNLLKNGNFAAGLANWSREEHQGADAVFAVTNQFDGQPAVRIEVVKPGSENWHVQLNQPGLRISSNQVYTFTFYAKASEPADLSVSVMEAHADWAPLGYNATVGLSTDWQLFKGTFLASRTDSNARPNFGGFATRKVTVWLADVRVQAGGQVGVLPPGSSLESHTIPNVPRIGSTSAATVAMQRDWLRFLIDLEQQYWLGMTRHIRETCGYSGLVFGTIIANSPPSIQAQLDVIDAHAYWQHPQFPGQPWDAANWFVSNISMVNTLGSDNTLASLARQRVRGKPFTVTEYQHPSPNYFSAEGPLLLAAYGALQDWDGLWLFEYGRGNDTTRTGCFQGFFDTAQHPSKMANVVLAATLFRRSDVLPARTELATDLSADLELETMLKAGSAWAVMNGGLLGVPGKLAFTNRLSLSLNTNSSDITPVPTDPQGNRILSDTGQLDWNLNVAGKGWVTMNTPNTKIALGFVDDRPFDLGGIVFQVGTTQLSWASLGLTLIEGQSMTNGARLLLIAGGQIDNSQMRWLDAAKTTVGTNWGHAPTLVEVVPFRLILPLNPAFVKAFTLDGSGQRSGSIPVSNLEGHSLITITNTTGSLWYEIWTAPASGFERWRFSQFNAAQLEDINISGALAIPAGDQMPNLLKYALALPALESATDSPWQGLIWREQNQSFAAAQYPHSLDANDVILNAEISQDLIHWSSYTNDIALARVVPHAHFEQCTVRAQQPLSRAGCHFLRLTARFIP